MSHVGRGLPSERRLVYPAPDVADMGDAEDAGYPAELEREACLRDGTRVRIRPIRAEDLHP